MFSENVVNMVQRKPPSNPTKHILPHNHAPITFKQVFMNWHVKLVSESWNKTWSLAELKNMFKKMVLAVFFKFSLDTEEEKIKKSAIYLDELLLAKLEFNVFRGGI